MPQQSHTHRWRPWEKIHELNLRRTFVVILVGLFVLLIVTIVFAYFVDNHVPWVAKSNGDAKVNWYFIISVVISLYSAYFTLSAYWIARKVEEYVRMPIRHYPDFIEQARMILEEGFGEFKVMVYYPAFNINKKVQNEGGRQVDDLLLQMANRPNIQAEILVLDAMGQEKFLSDMKSEFGITEPEILNARTVYQLLEEGTGFDNKIRGHSGSRFPIHMFWSSNVMTFVAIHNPEKYPNKDLKCSGFTSHDPDIQAAFKMIFDDYYSNGVVLAKPTT